MNLRENGLPVDPSPPSGASGQSSFDPKFVQIAAPIAAAARPPAFHLIRAVILAAAGVLTGSQVLVAGGCFFLALAIREFIGAWGRRPVVQGGESLTSARVSVNLLFGALVMSMAAGLTVHGVLLLQSGVAFNRVNWIALVVAFGSLLISDSVVGSATLVGRWIFGAASVAQLSASSSAALASILVFTGALGNVAGLTVLDPFAAVLVAALVFRAGWWLILEANSA